MVTTIVGISGVIGSGKTSIASALGERVPSATVRSFGDVVRQEAQARGRGLARVNLQDTGVELIEEGWAEFVSKVLTPLPDSDLLVVDGIRHVEATAELKRRWPAARFFLVYVQSNDETVEARLSDRGERPGVLAHPVEAELPEIYRRADLLLVDSDLTHNVGAILSALEPG